MASVCWASIRGEVARFTQLDNCCAPVTAACGQVTTNGFISVVLTQEISAASVITVKNAQDQICIYDPGCDSLLDLSAVITMCNVNPELVALTTGQELVLDYAGNAVGFRRSTNLQCANRFALEIWTDVPGACSGTPPLPNFGYFLVPCLRSATITGPITINGTSAINVELTAKTTIPSLWGTGPQTADGLYKVVPTNSSNVPGYLLTSIGATDHDHVELTTVPPPVVSGDCGCVPVTITGAALPQVIAVEPNPIAAAGGEAVEIVGSSFTGTTGVTFGGTALTHVVVIDDSHVLGVAPAKTAGSYPVLVTTGAGVNTNVYNVTYV